MRGKRFLLFLIMIGLGAALGMVYGWVIQPLSGSESDLKALRYDYRADYVLMVAEIYAADGDLAQAEQRLAQVSERSPALTATEALETARSLEWAEADLEKMEALAQALGPPSPSPEGEEQP
jgi:hypothetical protein